MKKLNRLLRTTRIMTSASLSERGGALSFFQSGKMVYKALALFVISIISSTQIFAAPTIGTLNKNQVNISTGVSYLILNGLSGANPTTYTVQSSNTNVLSVVGAIAYNQGQSIGVISVIEKGTAGSVTLTVTGSDVNGNTSKTFSVAVGNYSPNGGIYSIYDYAFWNSNFYPSDQVSKHDTIISSLNDKPTYRAFFRDLTAGREVGKYFQASFRGIFFPSQTGWYQFKISSEGEGNQNDGGGFSIYPTAVRTGSPITDKRVSAAYLTAGNPYAFQATGSIIENNTNFHAEYYFAGTSTISGPSYITLGGSVISPYYDIIIPSTPTNLTAIRKSTNKIDIRWKRSSDNYQLAGYKVYSNGIMIKDIKSLTDSTYRLSGLTPNTFYDICVTSYDVAGNESNISNIIRTSTYANETTAPAAPTALVQDIIGDMGVKISWTAPTDPSDIFGYKIYLDNMLYNSDTLNATSIVIGPLQPLSSHAVTVEAIDGAGNVSVKSTATQFTTKKFDANTVYPGVKKLKANVFPEYIGYSEGVGLNGGHDGNYYDADIQALVKAFQPGANRWGALGANPLNFDTYAGTSAPGGTSIAKFINNNNKMGAWTAFTCGVKNSTDWRLDLATFTYFMDYIAGPGTTIYGRKRINEGYTASLLSSCPGIIFELGNEVWGASSHNAEIGADYEEYAKWCRSVAGVIKASPYYDPKKFFIINNGRDVAKDSYATKILAADDGNAGDWLSVSGYMGGNLTYDLYVPKGTTFEQYYQSGFGVLAAKFKGLKEIMNFDASENGKVRPTYFYEANMTRSDYNNRLGQAVILTDYFTASMALGSAVPSLFALGGNNEWSINDGTNLFPTYLGSQLINKYSKGDILKVANESAYKLYDTDGTQLDIDPVGVFSTHKAGKYSIVLFSRDYLNDYQVRLNIHDSIIKSGQATKIVMTGTDFNTKNAIITSTGITLNDSSIITVPKFSMVVITFGGGLLKSKSLTLGYTKYLKPSNIQINAPDNGVNIDVPSDYRVYTASVIPASSKIRSYTWEVINPNNVAITTNINEDGSLNVGSSGDCNGNGTITLRAYLDDPNIYSDQVVVISNQNVAEDGTVTPCQTSTVKAESKTLKIYPNPSEGSVTIESAVAGSYQITTAQGIVVKTGVLTSEVKSTTLTLQPGIYIAQLKQGNTVVSKKIVVR